MTRLIKAEIFKLRKRSMTLILMYILLAVILLTVFLIQATITTDNGVVTLPGNISLLEQVIPVAMAILANFGVLLAVILVVSSIGNEYSWQTLRPYLLCSESRLKMLTAKLIAVCIFIIAGMVIAVITAVLLGVLFTAIRGFSWDMSFFTMSFLGNQLLTFVRTFYVILPYSLLAFLFTVLGRSMAAGLGFGIGMVLLEPTITALMQMAHGWLAKIPDYLLHANVQVILSLSQSHLTIQTGQTAQLPGAFHAFVTVAIYSLVFIAIAFTLFRKRDVTG